MRGRRCAVIAALVAAGMRSRSDHRTGSPALAAHAAAGIANSGALEGATRTERVGAPAAAVCSLSIAWASSEGATPSTSVLRSPSGLAVLPMRMTCALPAFSAPVGPRSSSADCVASGSLSPSESRIGARSGRLISCAAEIAARQSLTSTSVTAAGRVSRERAG